MSKFSQTFVAYKGCGNCYMAQTKLFRKIEDVLCKHIIRLGKKQWTFVIESKQEHNLE